VKPFVSWRMGGGMVTKRPVAGSRTACLLTTTFLQNFPSRIGHNPGHSASLRARTEHEPRVCQRAYFWQSAADAILASVSLRGGDLAEEGEEGGRGGRHNESSISPNPLHVSHFGSSTRHPASRSNAAAAARFEAFGFQSSGNLVHVPSGIRVQSSQSPVMALLRGLYSRLPSPESPRGAIRLRMQNRILRRRVGCYAERSNQVNISTI
jgi:hypothetical protein